MAAYQRGDYATAIRELRPLAEQGNAEAQYGLGVMYEHGQGVPQDDAEAVKWYRKAAEQGEANAQFILGNMYDDGRGVTQDYAEALKWYRKAAEQGDAEAQYNLGVMYGNGRGVTQDYAEAVGWYRKAAEQGDVEAQYGLGLMYDNGQGVAQDYAEAVKWYRKAAEYGDADAHYALGVMYSEGQGVTQDDAVAVMWYRTAAQLGNAEAQDALAVMSDDEDDTAIQMIALSSVPDNLDDFLPWLKDRSEAAWANFKTATFDAFLAAGAGGSSWRTGTQWQIGLDGPRIDALERHWELKFPRDYRQFLSVLNAPDRGRYHVGWSDDPPYGMEEGDDQPSYFDWQNDDEEIVSALNWPLEGLIFDVENNALWPDSWGERPGEVTDAHEKVAQLVASAPTLIPITGHRYLLANSLEAGNPVLSVWGSDIICYGSNLRYFLLMEFSSLLGLDHDEVAEIANAGITEEKIAAIPFWGEFMLQEWTSRNSFLGDYRLPSHRR